MKYAALLVALVALLGTDAFRKSRHQFCIENALLSLLQTNTFVSC